MSYTIDNRSNTELFLVYFSENSEFTGLGFSQIANFKEVIELFRNMASFKKFFKFCINPVYDIACLIILQYAICIIIVKMIIR